MHYLNKVCGQGKRRREVALHYSALQIYVFFVKIPYFFPIISHSAGANEIFAPCTRGIAGAGGTPFSPCRTNLDDGLIHPFANHPFCQNILHFRPSKRPIPDDISHDENLGREYREIGGVSQIADSLRVRKRRRSRCARKRHYLPFSAQNPPRLPAKKSRLNENYLPFILNYSRLSAKYLPFIFSYFPDSGNLMGDSDAEIGNGGMRHGVFTFFSDVKIFYIFADTNSAFKIGGPWRHTRGPRERR